MLLITIFILSCNKENIVETIQPDYFPIKVNTSIRYKYYSSASGGVYTFEDEGEAVWNINSMSENNGIKIFTAVETKTYSSRINGGAPTLQTKETPFEITEDSFNRVTIKSLEFSNISFNRFSTGVATDFIRIPIDAGGYIDLKKNVGLYNIFRLGNRWSQKYELIE